MIGKEGGFEFSFSVGARVDDYEMDDGVHDQVVRQSILYKVVERARDKAYRELWADTPYDDVVGACGAYPTRAQQRKYTPREWVEMENEFAAIFGGYNCPGKEERPERELVHACAS